MNEEVELTIFVKGRSAAINHKVVFTPPYQPVTTERVVTRVQRILKEGFLFREHGQYIDAYIAPSAIKEIRWIKRDVKL